MKRPGGKERNSHIMKGYRESEVWLIKNQWYIAGALFVVTMVLGVLGFRQYYIGIGEPRSFFDYLYLTLQLFGLSSGSVPGDVNPMLQIARFLAPALAIYALMKALIAIFYEQFKRLRVMCYRNHYVVCGLGRKGFNITKTLRDQHKRVVVIEIDPENTFVKPVREMHAVVFIGTATDENMLKWAKIKKAKRVYAVCGRDMNNLIIANALLNDDDFIGGDTDCMMHVEDHELFSSLMVNNRERIECIDMYEEGAKSFLEKNNPFSSMSEKINDLHLVFFGQGRAGRRLVLHALRWKDWNSGLEGLKMKPRVTVFSNMKYEKKGASRLPLNEFDKDVSLFEKPIENYDTNSVKANMPLDATHIYICTDEDTRNISMALAAIGKKGIELSASNKPVVVCMNDTIKFNSEDEEEDPWVKLPMIKNLIYYSAFIHACKGGIPFGE